MFVFVHINEQEAEKAEKEASDRLQDVTRRKRGASDKERRELEDEEKRLHKVAKGEREYALWSMIAIKEHDIKDREGKSKEANRDMISEGVNRALTEI